ncbi:MAG: hypothetical protein H0W33_10780 [Gammaproteobacteria bacterium]|nr:hypothetical protein [Gammaproteobacteria bacterium]
MVTSNNQAVPLGFIAQTNVQLYNQLRRSGRSLDELALVHRAYQLTVSLYSGCFQADGKPVAAHVAGVASILARLDLPVEIVAAACIHNIYGNGDFGDGRGSGVTPYRRRVVSGAVGKEVEACVYRFSELRLNHESVPDIGRRLDRLDVRDRHLIVMELADILEKYMDQGILYFRHHNVTRLVADHSELLIEMADRLGYPQLASALGESFAATAADSVPEALRAVTGDRCMNIVIPRSCQLRTSIATLKNIARIKRGIRMMLRYRA